LFNAGRSSLNRRQLWVVLLYAGYPSMLIGTVVSALNLGISYNTIYVFGLIGYLFFILARLERQLHPELKASANNRNNSDDDSDLDF